MLSQFAEKSGMAVRNKEEAVKAQRYTYLSLSVCVSLVVTW